MIEPLTEPEVHQLYAKVATAVDRYNSDAYREILRPVARDGFDEIDFLFLRVEEKMTPFDLLLESYTGPQVLGAFALGSLAKGYAASKGGTGQAAEFILPAVKIAFRFTFGKLQELSELNLRSAAMEDFFGARKDELYEAASVLYEKMLASQETIMTEKLRTIPAREAAHKRHRNHKALRSRAAELSATRRPRESIRQLAKRLLPELERYGREELGFWLTGDDPEHTVYRWLLAKVGD